MAGPTEPFVKAYSSPRDPVGPYLEDCQHSDTSPQYVLRLCPQVTEDALNLVTRTGQTAITQLDTETILATPWVPYADDRNPLSPLIRLGHVRLEAITEHSPVSSAIILGVGVTAIRLVARPTDRAKPERVMAVLSYDGLAMAVRGSSDFYPADIGAFNFLRCMIEFSMREILLPKNPLEVQERTQDQKTDANRRRRSLGLPS